MNLCGIIGAPGARPIEVPRSDSEIGYRPMTATRIAMPPPSMRIPGNSGIQHPDFETSEAAMVPCRHAARSESGQRQRSPDVHARVNRDGVLGSAIIAAGNSGESSSPRRKATRLSPHLRIACNRARGSFRPCACTRKTSPTSPRRQGRLNLG